jgi:MFS family permease
LTPAARNEEVGLSPAFVALPVMLQSLMFFLSTFFWGWMADRVGRRWALILPAICGLREYDLLGPLELGTSRRMVDTAC